MSPLEQTIERITGSRATRLSPLGGGCIGDVFKVDLANGQTIVAKTGDPGSGLALEGRMLEYLGQYSQLPVPGVLYCDVKLVLMDWLPATGALDDKGEVEAADRVAALHDITAERFGFDWDTVIGGLHQPNPSSDTWLPFFAEHRLIYMGRQALDAGRLPPDIMDRLEKFSAHLDTWLAEPAHPSLIHGDMWGGNVVAAGGKLSGFIDPAIYFAHGEIELAFTTLFNTFSERFYDRYREHRPIAPGFFKERRDIYNLYPLLVHVRLFGGSYVGSIDRTLARFGF
ncbi:MAG TPA: fructosamine kinase [Rhodospirillales bacterium]|nr:fructosamine kinase [Rhodospirillales bacterium]